MSRKYFLDCATCGDSIEYSMSYYYKIKKQNKSPECKLCKHKKGNGRQWRVKDDEKGPFDVGRAQDFILNKL